MNNKTKANLAFAILLATGAMSPNTDNGPTLNLVPPQALAQQLTAAYQVPQEELQHWHMILGQELADAYQVEPEELVFLYIRQPQQPEVVAEPKGPFKEADPINKDTASKCENPSKIIDGLKLERPRLKDKEALREYVGKLNQLNDTIISTVLPLLDAPREYIKYKKIRTSWKDVKPAFDHINKLLENAKIAFNVRSKIDSRWRDHREFEGPLDKFYQLHEEIRRIMLEAGYKSTYEEPPSKTNEVIAQPLDQAATNALVQKACNQIDQILDKNNLKELVTKANEVLKDKGSDLSVFNQINDLLSEVLELVSEVHKHSGHVAVGVNKQIKEAINKVWDAFVMAKVVVRLGQSEANCVVRDTYFKMEHELRNISLPPSDTNRFHQPPNRPSRPQPSRPSTAPAGRTRTPLIFSLREPDLGRNEIGPIVFHGERETAYESPRHNPGPGLDTLIDALRGALQPPQSSPYRGSPIPYHTSDRGPTISEIRLRYDHRIKEVYEACARIIRFINGHPVYEEQRSSIIVAFNEVLEFANKLWPHRDNALTNPGPAVTALLRLKQYSSEIVKELKNEMFITIKPLPDYLCPPGGNVGGRPKGGSVITSKQAEDSNVDVDDLPSQPASARGESPELPGSDRGEEGPGPNSEGSDVSAEGLGAQSGLDNPAEGAGSVTNGEVEEAPKGAGDPNDDEYEDDDFESPSSSDDESE